MEIGEFIPRHAFLDLVNLKATVTSQRNPENTFVIDLIKVPEHKVSYQRRQIIDEGGGWYSKGDFETIVVNYEAKYLAIKDNVCIGVFEPKETKSGKVPLQKLDGFKKAKEILKTI